MTVQPTVKGRSAFDWLCYVLVSFAALCLVASVPQTFTMVRVAHDDFGSAILVVVLEVMAFFALLAPLWVPTWAKTFDRIAYTLLGITTLGNYAGGWNYVWTHNEMGPFWMSIRDWREPIFGLPLATIALVAVLSGLVPFAMKFFASLAIKRYRENELDRSPEAVAQRAIEPVLVQIIATQRLKEQLAGLTETFQEPLLLQGKAQAQVSLADVRALLGDVLAQREGEQRRPFEGMEATREASVSFPCEDGDCLEPCGQCDDGYSEVERNCRGCFGPCGMCEEAAQPVTEAQEAALDEMVAIGQAMGDYDPRTLDVDAFQRQVDAELLKMLSPKELLDLPDSPEKDAEMQRRIGKNIERGLDWMVEQGWLERKQPADQPEPATGMPAEAEPSQEAAPEVAPLKTAHSASEDAPVVIISADGDGSGAVYTWECADCHKPGTNGTKGKATRWMNDHNQSELYCADCRKSGRHG